MDKVHEPTEQKPVKNLRKRSPQSGEIRPGIIQRVVRSLRLKDKGSPTQPSKISSAYKILLYRDMEIIQEMRSRVIATALRDENIFGKLKRFIAGQSLLSGEFTFDGLAGVDEFVLKPSAKWTFGAEVGADFELKWILSNDANADNIILTLCAVMPTRSASEVVRQIRSQRSNTPVNNLIYPDMPISVWGVIRHRDDLSSKEITLRNERYKIQAVLNQKHSLDQAVSFLKGRPLHILGIVQNIEKVLTIKSGAILLVQVP